MCTLFLYTNWDDINLLIAINISIHLKFSLYFSEVESTPTEKTRRETPKSSGTRSSERLAAKLRTSDERPTEEKKSKRQLDYHDDSEACTPSQKGNIFIAYLLTRVH